MYQDLPLLTDKQARDIITAICKEKGITIDLIEQLVAIQRDNLGKGKQRGISQEFSAVVSAFLEEQGD